MIENDKNIQNWSEENRQALLQFIIDHCGVEGWVDICAVGSRICREQYDMSDIDVVVYLPLAERMPNSYHLYDDTPLVISYYNTNDPQFPKQEGIWHMPSYSLITGVYDPGVEEDIAAYRLRFQR
ncbi:MAG: hypothetical protein SFT92_02305 [Rickettsiales bacterium]|nr:hypothetical protein [Rickettsiales bacterium]